ncbi:ecto-ADP-ribosyltransferase 5-like [Hoplias malabaricus]|uniref:ecto-ADP-ribosyltransferase 5-like n=1 Tax=Hoplias malabaricus TaxID=27720 RepID=UPI00346301BF
MADFKMAAMVVLRRNVNFVFGVRSGRIHGYVARDQGGRRHPSRMCNGEHKNIFKKKKKTYKSVKNLPGSVCPSTQGPWIEMTEYPKSIDDDFDGCTEEMYDLVTSKYLKEELKSDFFRTAWEDAGGREVKLTPDNLRTVAVRAYSRDIYLELNDRMREGKDGYKTSFGLISLHFLLTDAIQTLNPRGTCQTAYRFSCDKFKLKGRTVRFGSFASSTRDPKLRRFGSETCFIITTCHGADITSLSVFTDETEILIPPYERFEEEPLGKVPLELRDCKRIIRLKSIEKKSNMKCELVPKKKKGCLNCFG